MRLLAVFILALFATSAIAETNEEHHKLTEKQISDRINQMLKKSYPPYEKMFEDWKNLGDKTPFSCAGKPAVICNEDPAVHHH